MTNRKKLAALGTLLLTASSSGCAVDHLAEPWCWHKPEVADVYPQRKSRSDDVARDFDRRRNEAQFQAAESSWRQGDYVTCRESLEKVLYRDPNHREALFLMADVALETDEPVEAVEIMRRMAALNPQDAEVAYRLGLSLEATGEFAEAIPYLRQAATSEPNNAIYVDACAQAERHVAEIDTIAADADGNTGDVSSDAVADELLAEAVADWEAGRDGDAAEKIGRLLALQPDHKEANILQAEIEVAAGEWERAFERMNRLTSAHPRDARVFRAFGLLAELAGDATKAVHCFAEAQRLANAADAAASVVQATFTAPAPESNATDVLTAAPEPPSVTDLDDADLDADPTELLREGQQLLKAKRFDAARQPLRAAIQRSGNDSQAAFTAAVAALKAEQPELSFELATLGVKRFPTSAGLHQVRGMAAYRMRRYGEAEAALRQSLNLDNSQALSYFLLGSALEHLGQPEEGERYRSEAARLDARYALRK